MKKVALLLLFAALISNCHSQSELFWSNPIVVADGSIYGAIHPRVVLTDNNFPLIVWGKNGPAETYAARWNGTDFDSPITVNPQGIEPYSNNWTSPEVDASGDSVFIVYKTLPLVSGNIYVQRSVNGGISFGDTLKVDNIGNGVSFLPTIGVASGGNPVVAFMRHEAGWANPRYVATKSIDGGATFLPDVPASTISGTEVCDCCPARIISEGARQSLLFRNNDNNLRDIWVAVSTDNGATFPVGADIDSTNWVLPACPATGPDGIIKGDSVIAVWLSQGTGISRVWIAAAHLSTALAGQTVQVADNVLGGTSQNYPRIAGINDTIGITWQQLYSGDINTIFTYSTAGIAGLNGYLDTVNVALAGAQRNPDVAYADGTFYLTWQDEQNNKVMFRTASIVNVGINENRQSTPVVLFPNPTNSTFTISGNYELSAMLYLYDITGRQVAQISIDKEYMAIDVKWLSEGVYLWQFGNARGKLLKL